MRRVKNRGESCGARARAGLGRVAPDDVGVEEGSGGVDGLATDLREHGFGGLATEGTGRLVNGGQRRL